MNLCRPMGVHPVKHKMFSEKSGGKGKKDQKLWNAANGAQIQDPVIVLCIGAEPEAAALIAVDHAGVEQKAPDLEGFCFVQKKLAESVLRRE